MSDQRDLFAGPLASPHPMARRTDPHSSHAAADKLEASGNAQRQRDEALSLVRKFPGFTAERLAQVATAGTRDCPSCRRNTLSRRLAELRDEGLVQNAQEDGPRGLRWFPRSTP